MSCGKKCKSDGRTYLFGGIDAYWSKRRPKCWAYVLRHKITNRKKIGLLWDRYIEPLEKREFRIGQIEHKNLGLVGMRYENGKVIKTYRKEIDGKVVYVSNKKV